MNAGSSGPPPHLVDWRYISAHENDTLDQAIAALNEVLPPHMGITKSGHKVTPEEWERGWYTENGRRWKIEK